MENDRPIVKLPRPRTDSSMALEAALAARRTIRHFQPHPLTEAEVGQLLWAAQGVTHEGHKRTAPSASGLNGLETYIATAEGLARYLPDQHALQPLGDDDLRPRLEAASGGQHFVRSAPLIVILAIAPGRIAVKHGPERSVRYADFEAGHAGQNLLLQAVALDLGGVPIGSFDDDQMNVLLELPAGEEARYLFAIGRPAQP